MPAALASTPLFQPISITECSPHPTPEAPPHVPPHPLPPLTTPASPSYISQPTASSLSRLSAAAPPSQRVLAERERSVLNTWTVDSRTRTRPASPKLTAPRPSVSDAGTQPSSARPPTWSGVPTKPVAPRFSVARALPPAGGARPNPLGEWTPEPTKPVAPQLSTSFVSAPKMEVIARAATAEWTGKLTVPKAPRFGPSRAREVPGVSAAVERAVVTEQGWSRAQTRPRSPKFSQRARAPAAEVEAVVVTKKPQRSAAERRAAFERLTKPVVRIAVVPAPRERVRARTGGNSQYFERLSKPFPRHSAVELEPIGFTGQRLSEQYTGRATQQREFKLSSSNASSTRMSVPAVGSPVSLGRPSYAEQYDGKPSRTVPAPFKLRGVGLHETAQEKLRQEKEKEEKAMDDNRKYKAVKLSAKMLQGPTFVPVLKPAEEVCTVPEDTFCRESDERAKQRLLYEAEKAERLAQEAQDAKEAEEERKVLAEKMRKTQFKENSFKAQPVPNFSDYKEPEKPAVPPLPPTSPKTPSFCTRSRAARRFSEENDAGQINGPVEWF